MDEQYRRGVHRVVVRGPAETPAVVRLFTGDKTQESVAAYAAGGNRLDVQWQQDGATALARFDNEPAGVTLEIRWK